ncbi:MAG: phosphoribosylformylglycinamidine synthase [Myxococcales bacterium]|nr:phosphoribosylformylglycinamidine synthase [Myxococcales bacterium]
MSPTSAVRIEVAVRPELPDARGAGVERTIQSFLGIGVRRVRTRDVYRITGGLDPREAEKLRAELTDPVLQVSALGKLEGERFDFAIGVGFKPGVTDPVGKSAKVAVEDTLGRKLGATGAVYTSTLYLLDGVDRAQAERVALELLANPVIQTTHLQSFEEWRAQPPDLSVPVVPGHDTPAVARVDLSGSDAELERLSKQKLLALTLGEMKAIRDHFRAQAAGELRRAAGLGSEPTDVELECLAQTWSEHCKHKIFNATVRYREGDGEPEVIDSVFKAYVRGTTEAVERAVVAREGKSWLVSVFHDNAGVVEHDDQHHLVYKVETHNSPSALDPYGGAMTGIVGVNRDPFGTGLGAELSSNVWGYCFASPFHSGPLPKGLLHPRRIRDGVHQGVIDGGNQSGIPYGRGWEIFDHRFLGKPLVFCGTVGVLPVTVAGRPSHEKAALPGDAIVMVGGRIGADGIHGATFSSAALDESAPIQAVQIGDPITQKRMFDFLVEARDLGLYRAITDNGAGGLSSSVGEMAEKPGGARLELEKAPLKYAGLAPWEILLSEAQERMTLAVAPEHVAPLLALAARREVDATAIGAFTSDGYLHVTHRGKTVGLLEMAFLHEGDPDLDLTARWVPPRFDEPRTPPPADLGQTLVAMVGRLDLCSNEAKARHYDHEVKGLTVIKPFVGVRSDVPAEASVFLVRHGSLSGYVLSEGVNPFYSDIDCFAMAQAVVDEAVRRQLAAGARLDRIALLDNFCWPDPVAGPDNPDGEYKMAQLVRACRGLYEAAVAYGAPLISGKDSMKNDSRMGGVKISVPPTLLLSAIGRIDDVNGAVTLEPKAAGDVVYLLGETRDETGGSEYFRLRGERDGLVAELGQPAPYVGNKVPELDLATTLPRYRALESAIRAGWVRSVAVPAKGGLGVALSRMAMAARLGLDLDLNAAADLARLEPDVALFSESLGRLVVTVAARDTASFEACVAGTACHRLGSVVSAPTLTLRRGSAALVSVAVDALVTSFQATLGGAS